MKNIVLFLTLFLVVQGTQAQTSVDVVSDYGAVGDARQVWVSTTSGSVVIGFTNTLSSGDIGKTVELFGVGPEVVGMAIENSGITGWQQFSNPQTNGFYTMAATITNIVNGTNLQVYVAALFAPVGPFDTNQWQDNPTVMARTNASAFPTTFTLSTAISTNYIGHGMMIYDSNGGYIYASTPVTNHMGMVAVITNVVGNNAYLSGDLAGVTTSAAYCWYGHNNTASFQNAIDAATGTNTTINIPAGQFLMFPQSCYSNYVPVNVSLDVSALHISKGGMTIKGASRSSTVLIANGAWKRQMGIWKYEYYPHPTATYDGAIRGTIFAIVAPVTNDYPLVFESLTMDGGMPLAETGYQNIQPTANSLTGYGWDGSSAAGVDTGYGNLNSLKTFRDCEFRHFMSEMIKGVTGVVGSEQTIITNCSFWDGNATAFNYNTAHTIDGCTFSNMYQVEEFYLYNSQQFPSYFINNYCTNIAHNIVSLNGGTLTNQPYTISNNLIYAQQGNQIGTCPAANVLIASNTFVCQPGGSPTAISIGQVGAQAGSPDAFNTNIWIIGNTFSNSFFTILETGGSSNDVNHTEGLWMTGNRLAGTAVDGVLLYRAYGWSRNINIYSNDFGGLIGSGGAPGRVLITSGIYDTNSPFAYMEANGNYATDWSSASAATNGISYGYGSRQTIDYAAPDNRLILVGESVAHQMPSGATMTISDTANRYNPATNIVIQLSESNADNVYTLTNGTTETFFWSGTAWSTNSSGDSPIPPVYPVFIPGHKYYRLKIH